MPVSGGTGIVWGVDLFCGVLCGVCASGWLLPMLPPSSGLRARQHDASSGSACAKRGRGRCIQHSCWQPTNCPPWALLETASSQVVTGCHGDQPQHLLTLPRLMVCDLWSRHAQAAAAAASTFSGWCGLSAAIVGQGVCVVCVWICFGVLPSSTFGSQS